MSLFDQHNNPIPQCNIHDAKTNTHLYVKDVAGYTNTSKELDHTKMISMVTSGVVCIFFCIFSLNFGVSGWTAGNLLTFGLGVASFLILVQYGSKYTENVMEMKKNQKTGVPCTQKSGDNNIVYCKVPQVNSFTM